jgi:hypothetical protein
MENITNNNFIIEYNQEEDKCIIYMKTQDIIYEDFDNKIPNDYYKLEDLGLIKIYEISIDEFHKYIYKYDNKLKIKINYKSFLNNKKFNNTIKIIEFINNFMNFNLLNILNNR